MRFHAVVLAGLMVAAAAVPAQQVKANDPQMPTQLQKNAAIPAEQQRNAVIVLQNRATALNEAQCPGALEARQQATGGAEVWTTALGDQAAAKPRGLGIHVEFEGGNSRVKALELRVDYLPLGLHVLPIAPLTTSAAALPQERAKTFNLDRVPAMRIIGDLLVGPAATVTRVHLVSATFADGTVWRAPSADACTVVPSRIMQVARR